VHVDGSVDPIRDKETIDYELIMKDLEAVEKKLEKVNKAAKTGNKEAIKAQEALNKYKSHFEDGKAARSADVTEDQKEHVLDLFLLTNKPILYVCNVSETEVNDENEYVKKVRETAKEENAEVIVIAAALEADIAELEDADERTMFLEDAGLSEPGVNKLIKSAYSLLNLQTYFTAGKKEVRAWTIKIGMTAPQAAGVIHSDFERGFIKAEVIKFDDWINFGSEQAVKEAGKMSMEGKEYVVQDGDVMHFKFNV
jgi:GTP-binding protein YchF